MNTLTPLQKAFHLCGGPYGISKICRVSNTSVLRWKKNGTLPRTEWTGESNYAALIEDATGGAITKAELLACPPQRRVRNSTP